MSILYNIFTMVTGLWHTSIDFDKILYPKTNNLKPSYIIFVCGHFSDISRRGFKTYSKYLCQFLLLFYYLPRQTVLTFINRSIVELYFIIFFFCIKWIILLYNEILIRFLVYHIYMTIKICSTVALHYQYTISLKHLFTFFWVGWRFELWVWVKYFTFSSVKSNNNKITNK